MGHILQSRRWHLCQSIKPCNTPKMTPYGTSQLLDHQGIGSALCYFLFSHQSHRKSLYRSPNPSCAVMKTTQCRVQFAGIINQKTKLNPTRPDVLLLCRAPSCIKSKLYFSHKPLSNIQLKRKTFLVNDLIHRGSRVYQQPYYICTTFVRAGCELDLPPHL